MTNTNHSDLDNELDDPISLPRLCVVRREDGMYLNEASERGKVWGFRKEKAQRFGSLVAAHKHCGLTGTLEFV